MMSRYLFGRWPCRGVKVSQCHTYSVEILCFVGGYFLSHEVVPLTQITGTNATKDS